jgi:flavin reductase (DIM6/NTAB) family NADH-FMN oxidoreductase RutF
LLHISFFSFFQPTEAMLQTCEESGTDLAQAVKKANSRARKSKEKTATSAASSAVEQAVGRVVGSLCVVTSKSGDAESAMLASWVSQASFNPPGLTVAVSDCVRNF